MTRLLEDAMVRQYEEDGFCAPIPVLDAAEVAHCACEVE